MQFTLLVDQQASLEWELNTQQAILFSFVHQLPTWAGHVNKNGDIFYAISKQKIVDELPILTDKPDTAYRLLRQLQEKGVVELSSTSKITLVRITKKGKRWNMKEEKAAAHAHKSASTTSEKYPIKGGEISDQPRKNIRQTSDKSPTNQCTSNQVTRDPKDSVGQPDFAADAIAYLNLKAGRNFKSVPSSTKLIHARSKEGATLADFKAVIDRKCAEWLGDQNREQYLRPATLFNAEKFNNYLGQLGAPMPAANSNGQRNGDGNAENWTSSGHSDSELTRQLTDLEYARDNF
ncbi:phage conserved hypothetical protein, C-terminal domain-containing protein [Marinobacter sp. LV10R510-11A]|uniref:conserved phage C-terminal domain-containing protein n=1 Tax=Marinobacter sp. LV10R510-11A TaxID=1415568 RepID=UPI000BB85976|nr:conserved phage C-terminal domain-containing protein [Marinobacter sp. LV10R510-11A]SOB76161.1 phage conserved hypothetical protein, C-terminal domain-containing protein [Marinobacter sp. LV10R510-11A]